MISRPPLRGSGRGFRSSPPAVLREALALHGEEELGVLLMEAVWTYLCLKEALY